MKKNGFVSMTLVYTFLILFLFLMLAILTAYSDKNKFIDAINKQIDEDINSSKSSRYSLINKMLIDNTASEDINIKFYNISNITTGNGNGLFYTEEVNRTDENADGSSSRIYYYRGEVNNNYVIFAGICFRIVRTNENGTIRMMYGGKPTDGKCPQKITKGITESPQAFNGSTTDVNGLTYITSDDASANQSDLKSILDNWYYTNIANKRYNNNVDYPPYSAYVNDSIFCNGKNPINVLTNRTYYDAYSFIPQVSNDIVSLNPTFTCSRKEDRYNLSMLSGGSDDSGNNLLSYPVGLLSVSDIIHAGGYLTIEGDTYLGGEYGIQNLGYYMNIDHTYWTMSPYYYDSEEHAKMVCVNQYGTLIACDVDSLAEVIPVISIKSNISISSGIGTYDEPYVIK